MWAKFCAFMLKAMGWETVGGPSDYKKAIILGVPHTSFWDFIVSYLFYTQFNKTAHVMIKKELFWGPVGWFLRGCGCIPVDRSSAASMVKSLIEQMEKEDEFILAIAPEGTREPVKKWKTGYHLIAKEVGCPVYMGFFDWGKKRVGKGELVELTDDARKDTDRIQQMYEEMHLKGKHPEKYITH